MITDETIRALQLFLQSTALGSIVRGSIWMWPVLESLHFVGMSLLVGTVGMFDLRLLGFARRVPVAALHRLIPFGVAGFLLNAATGICFLAAFPGEYLYNAAFQAKVAFFVVAGANVALFYTATFRRLRTLGPEDPSPIGARIAGLVSLVAWVGVMAAGRMLTFFRGHTGVSFGS